MQGLESLGVLSRALKVSVSGWAWLATEFCGPVPEPNSPYLWTGRRRALQNWAWRRLELQTCRLTSERTKAPSSKGAFAGSQGAGDGAQMGVLSS